jgi:hypothetical protein
MLLECKIKVHEVGREIQHTWRGGGCVNNVCPEPEENLPLERPGHGEADAIQVDLK